MREVRVLGVGTSAFGVMKDQGIRELSETALWEALQDADVRPEEVQVAYCGNGYGGLASRQAGLIGQLALGQVGITKIPVTRVENACASSSCAFREAWMAVAGGFYDVALAFGVEKMTERSTADVTRALAAAADVDLETKYGFTFPGFNAAVARRHMDLFGTTREQLALVAVKNHRHGLANPKAHFRKAITVEDVTASPLVADPLRLYDCCPASDGAAAAVLVAADYARRAGRPSVRIAAAVQTSGTFAEDREITTFDPTVAAAELAWETAGIGPEDVDVSEVHDCFTIDEIMHYEDLGFCPKGEGGRFVEEGHSTLGGRLPVNPGGGLKARGHPVGATGVAQVAELVWQLRGEAEGRQVENGRVGVAHCTGGAMHGDLGAVTVIVLTR
ncbi:MAG: thiolase domain-containing protein [Nitrospinota bacterium]|nr:thiolase domain-containing protein [Nitrospinota bacterium]HJM42670.1 thiolase domain-containing protein [Nitrospinota bacterium]